MTMIHRGLKFQFDARYREGMTGYHCLMFLQGTSNHRVDAVGGETLNVSYLNGDNK